MCLCNFLLVTASNITAQRLQGHHLSGKPVKPGNVREFDSCQGNIMLSVLFTFRMKHCYLPSACIESVILPQVKKIKVVISRMSIITELLHCLTPRPNFLKLLSYDILMMLLTVMCTNLALRKDSRLGYVQD